MTTLREAAQQALKSLRGYRREIGCEQPCDAERALEAALEQPEQEPVAWMVYTQDGKSVCVTDNPADFIEWRSFPLFTHPPRREWRGLTEDEILTEAARHLGEMHVENCGLGDIKDFARAIEAALKERNA